MLLNGRLLEVTNGCFVDAQREKPRLGVGQLQRNPTGGFGSACADHPTNLDRLKPSSKPRGSHRFETAHMAAFKFVG